MRGIHNFSPGPAALPKPVLEAIRDDWMDWQGTGVSILEISHRTAQFSDFLDQCLERFRRVLSVPEDYDILLQGGSARLQFAMIPLNLMGHEKNPCFAYVNTGYWSTLAMQQAKAYGDVHVSAVLGSEGQIPQVSDWDLPSSACYVHVTANETLTGIEYLQDPRLPPEAPPLVADMTSNLLSRPLCWESYGLVYAATPKNLGIAGLTVVVVRRDLLRPSSLTPYPCNYLLQARERSLYSTPPVFAIYVMDKVLAWVESMGGVVEMERLREYKAGLVYSAIDHSEGFYSQKVYPSVRSRMNVAFSLPSSELELRFLEEAEREGLRYLKGHPVSGGIRASLYNGVSCASVECLVDFMKNFMKKQA